MQIVDFESAKAYLESLIPKGKEDYEKIGLVRISALLREMGDPQSSYPTVHIGGTAGKGSVATMLAKIIETSGYKTGLHVSPHLQDIRERMQVDGKLPSEREFVDLVLFVKDCVERTQKSSGHERPSYFEALLAMTFENFRRKKVDVAIIEVGMGGRLDGTNVIKPKIVVLTNVGLDHMEFLGDTIEEIASEKVGIFKAGIDIVSGVEQPSVVGIVEEEAHKKGCNIELLGREIRYSRIRTRKEGSMFDLSVMGERYGDIELSMIGEHQVSNAALAIAAALGLSRHGFALKEKDFRKALSSVCVPGRFEIIKGSPVVIMDGAHNPMKVDALVKTIGQRYLRRKVFFVFAAKKDKNVLEMIGALSKVAAKFYFTSFESTTDFGKRMSYNPNELKSFTDIESEVIVDSSRAYAKALRDAGPSGIVCVTGSFYLVGELRGLL